MGAFEAYKAEFGGYPSGSSTVTLRRLQGDNPRQHNFLSPLRPADINKQGEYLDPWKTPYDIMILSDAFVRIRSAGPNKRFGDEDDLEQYSGDSSKLPK